MKPRFFFLIVNLLFIGCASTNPFQVPQGEGAFLVNTFEEKDSEYYGYYFYSADGKVLKPGWNVAENKARYIIPTGTRKFGIIIKYAPDGIGYNKPTYTYAGYVKIDTVEGFSYQARCKIRKDKASAKIWVEDTNGNKASDISGAVFSGILDKRFVYVKRFEKGRFIAFGEPSGVDPTPLYYKIGIDLEKNEEFEIPRLHLKLPNGPAIPIDKITPQTAKKYLTETIPFHMPVWKRDNLEFFVGYGYALEFIDKMLVYASISDFRQNKSKNKPAIGIYEDKLFPLPLTEKQLIEIIGKPDRAYKVLD